MISVIITTHGQRKNKLQRAIESVFGQSFTDFELIVIDDASTDDTESYCKSLETHPQFRYKRLTYNSGKQSIPKNIGTEMAKGEYIAYLDGDNMFRHDHLQVLWNALQNNSGVDLVYGDRMFHDESGQIPDQIGIFSEFNPVQILVKNYIDASDFLVKKQALVDIGGWDERYKRMADWNLVARLAKASAKMKRVPVIITDYYLGSDSISHKPEDPKQPDKAILWNPYELEVDLPYLHAVKDPTVAVYTVTHDPKKLPILQQCFKALHEKAGYPFHHVFILNGDLPETEKWLKENKVDHIISNKDNMGIAHACNQAVDYVKDKGFDLIFKCDDDMLTLSDDLIKVMVELWKKNHMMVYSAYPEGLINNAGGAPRIGYGTLGGHFLGITQHLGGFCRFMSTKIMTQCRFPDGVAPHWMEDLYFSQWAAKNSVGMAYIEDLRVEHLLLDSEK